LFLKIYPGYIKRARDNYEKWTTEPNVSLANISNVNYVDKVQWGKLDSEIQDVIVDLVYQGFTKGPRPMVYGMLNDKNIFADYISANTTLNQYEKGRRRADYLRGNY
nr:type VI secretion system tip protein VgrG [Vibrio anguillarum]